MSDDILEILTKQYIEEQECEEVIFSWQGGEPTLAGLDFFKKAVALQKKYADKKIIENDLQTNGILLDEKWCEFLKENRFLIGLSIDGPESIHDRYRKDEQGNPSFRKVLSSAELLKKYEIPFNSLTTVNRYNSKYPLEVYRFLKDKIRPRAMQFTPCVDARAFKLHPAPYWDLMEYPNISELDALSGGPKSIVLERSVLPDDYGRFLCDIFDEWYDNDVGKVFVYNFEYALSQWNGIATGVGCSVAPVCGKGLAIEHEGSIYACDHYVYPEHRLGNITSDKLSKMAFSKLQIRFGMNKRNKLPQYCKACDYLKLCNGGCCKDRIIRTPVGEPGLNYLCAGFKRFFGHVSGRLDKLL